MNQAQQPEALRLANALDRSTAEHDLFRKSAVELRRLHGQELANIEWMEKTAWVRKGALPTELGRHVADVIRVRIEAQEAELRRLHARVQELEGQQKREPLSYQQIRDAWYDCGIGTTYDISPSQDDIDWARAIERAHGITAQSEYLADDERDHADENAAITAGKVQAALQGRVG